MRPAYAALNESTLSLSVLKAVNEFSFLLLVKVLNACIDEMVVLALVRVLIAIVQYVAPLDALPFWVDII